MRILAWINRLSQKKGKKNAHLDLLLWNAHSFQSKHTEPWNGLPTYAKGYTCWGCFGTISLLAAPQTPLCVPRLSINWGCHPIFSSVPPLEKRLGFCFPHQGSHRLAQGACLKAKSGWYVPNFGFLGSFFCIWGKEWTSQRQFPAPFVPGWSLLSPQLSKLLAHIWSCWLPSSSF